MKYTFEELKKIANDYDLRLAGNGFYYGYDLWYKNNMIVLIKSVNNGINEKHNATLWTYGISYNSINLKSGICITNFWTVDTKQEVLNFIENQKNVIDKCIKELYIEKRKTSLNKDF